MTIVLSSVAVMAMAADAWSVGSVLQLPATDSNWWDKRALAGAVVLRAAEEYRMYYYGRGGELWNFGVKPFNASLPTGRIGMATSRDGLQFKRYRGPLEDGAIMDPSDDPSTFDSVHVAVGDVVKYDGKWWMFYFGGGMEETLFMGNLHKGLKLQSGVAISDDGVDFKRRKDPVLRVGESKECWDSNGVSWPRVIPPEEGSTRWLMSYHTRESGGFFSAGIATSDDGITWKKEGKVLSRGAVGAWDEGGVSVRHVLRIRSDMYIMLYEGSNYSFEFGIGLAISEDGLTWKRDEECGPEAGGPVLKARKGEDVFDNVVVGTPYVIQMEDGSLRMYYLGVGNKMGEKENKQSIGVAFSNTSDFRCWKRQNICN